MIKTIKSKKRIRMRVIKYHCLRCKSNCLAVRIFNDYFQRVIGSQCIKCRYYEVLDIKMVKQEIERLSVSKLD
jgi:hypothetical protein